MFYKNCMGVGSGGKRSISFLGKVKKIMIRGNPCTSEESAGRLMLLGKGQLCFIVPDVCFSGEGKCALSELCLQAVQYI